MTHYGGVTIKANRGLTIPKTKATVVWPKGTKGKMRRSPNGNGNTRK
jgi:hypothetical protein